MKKLIAVIFIAIMLAGCSAEPDKNLPLVEYAKALAGDDAQINAIEQLGGKIFFVEITVNGPGTFLGGAQDWNSFSSKVAYIGQHLFERQDVSRIRIKFISQNIDWAYADIEKKLLPQNFRDLTYLEFASFSHLDAGTAQAGNWLCEFYKKYESAKPGGKLPYGC